MVQLTDWLHDLASAGANLVGTFPDLFSQLPDLTLLFIANNPGVNGPPGQKLYVCSLEALLACDS